MTYGRRNLVPVLALMANVVNYQNFFSNAFAKNGVLYQHQFYLTDLKTEEDKNIEKDGLNINV